MKEYLKMDDVFYLPINESEIMWMAAHDSPDRLECAVHAINSHDELVAVNAQMMEALELMRKRLDYSDPHGDIEIVDAAIAMAKCCRK